MLVSGPPGCGKTMLAQRLPSMLPPLKGEQLLEVARLNSLSGSDSTASMSAPPFRAPHPSISAQGLVGSPGRGPLGELVLAHNGVLFLDELSEFSRPSLEALRQPIEDGHVAVVRGQRALLFPTRFTLVAATNPCPCGFAGSDRHCSCGEPELARHRRRLSGPLLDRLDLLMPVARPTAMELRSPARESSEQMRARVLAARERQVRRLAGTAANCNGQLDARLVRSHVRVEEPAERALGRAYDAGALSARGHDRVLRVACTIADLAERDVVGLDDVMQALALRLHDGDHAAVAA
jgi:magnesium chelatase family protein